MQHSWSTRRRITTGCVWVLLASVKVLYLKQNCTFTHFLHVYWKYSSVHDGREVCLQGCFGEKCCFLKISLFLFHMIPFQNLAPTLPTMHLSHCVTSLETIYLIACSFLWSHKRLYTTVFCLFLFFFKYAVVLQLTTSIYGRLVNMLSEYQQNYKYSQWICLWWLKKTSLPVLYQTGHQAFNIQLKCENMVDTCCCSHDESVLFGHIF